MTDPEFSQTNLPVRTRRVLNLLQAFESPNVTFIEADGSWPIVWERAQGTHIWDAEGKRYLDLTAAFGVAAAGHANPRVVKAGQRQMAKLPHAMGDVHPHALKAELARELSGLTFGRWSRAARRQGLACDRSVISHQSSVISSRGLRRGSAAGAGTGKTIFCNSGFEAVEAALKTSMLATGKPGVIAFEGAYHGLGYGALNATHRDHFRLPFRPQLGKFGAFVPFPTQPEQIAATEAALWKAFKRKNIGAILVEPLQARGGIRVPPPGFLPLLRRLCDERQSLLILDEIYTGFGRTGRWFACEHADVAPDLICLGKALTGGFPLSACVGRADLMDEAWPRSNGEAIHTSTFLGHPVGCAMALAQMAEIRRGGLVQRSRRLGNVLLTALNGVVAPPGLRLEGRGCGLMAGLELRLPDGGPATEFCLGVIKQMLHCGLILLPEGEHSNVVSFTPPLTISEAQLRTAVEMLQDIILDRARK